MLKKKYVSLGLASFTTPVGLQQFVTINTNERFGRLPVSAEVRFTPLFILQETFKAVQFALLPTE